MKVADQAGGRSGRAPGRGDSILRHCGREQFPRNIRMFGAWGRPFITEFIALIKSAKKVNQGVPAANSYFAMVLVLPNDEVRPPAAHVCLFVPITIHDASKGYSNLSATSSNDSKPIAASCQTRGAPFISPYRNSTIGLVEVSGRTVLAMVGFGACTKLLPHPCSRRPGPPK